MQLYGEEIIEYICPRCKALFVCQSDFDSHSRICKKPLPRIIKSKTNKEKFEQKLRSTFGLYGTIGYERIWNGVQIFGERCVLCDKTKNIVYHHLQYNPPIIVPLCRSCHIKEHLNDKKKIVNFLEEEMKQKSWEVAIF